MHQGLAKEAHKHQEEFKGWQLQLVDMHHSLTDSIKNMIKAQETFLSKQAATFNMLEKVLSIVCSVLADYGEMKTMPMYFISMVVIFTIKTVKQTHNTHFFLFFRWFVTWTFEVYLICIEIKQRSAPIMSLSWPPQSTVWLSYFSGCLRLAIVAYFFFRYKEYKKLSCKMLEELKAQSHEQFQILHDILKDITPPHGRTSLDHESSFKEERMQSTLTYRMRSTSQSTESPPTLLVAHKPKRRTNGFKCIKCARRFICKWHTHAQSGTELWPEVYLHFCYISCQFLLPIRRVAASSLVIPLGRMTPMTRWKHTKLGFSSLTSIQGGLQCVAAFCYMLGDF